MSLKTIIIDDEPFVRNDLSHMLSAFDEVEVACQAGSLSEARHRLASGRYDLVFLDVCLPGGTGFDLLPYIAPPSKVVFVTGHDEYAVDAFEVNALDYLVKPVSPERLSNTIRRLSPETIPPFAPAKDRGRIPVKTEAGDIFLEPATIGAVSSFGGNYTEVHLEDRDRRLCRKTLKEWEAQLPGSFLRVHRSTLVNPAFVSRVVRQKDGRFSVSMCQGMTFRVSRRMAPGLRNWLRAEMGAE